MGRSPRCRSNCSFRDPNTDVASANDVPGCSNRCPDPGPFHRPKAGPRRASSVRPAPNCSRRSGPADSATSSTPAAAPGRCASPISSRRSPARHPQAASTPLQCSRRSWPVVPPAGSPSRLSRARSAGWPGRTSRPTPGRYNCRGSGRRSGTGHPGWLRARNHALVPRLQQNHGARLRQPRRIAHHSLIAPSGLIPPPCTLAAPPIRTPIKAMPAMRSIPVSSGASVGAGPGSIPSGPYKAVIENSADCVKD